MVNADVCTQVEAFLKTRQYKLTAPRREIIRILNDGRKPLSIQEIYQQLKERPADLTSVYRTVNLLCELGILLRLEFHEKRYRYELSEAFTPHHHHAICRKCGSIENVFEECISRTMEERIGRQARFRIESHILEFYGLCGECAAQNATE